MPKTFLPYEIDQRLLLPPNMRDWLPEGHLALFIVDVVRALDLAEIRKVYEQGDGRGRPPYHPVMMVALLIYAYCMGKPSSRRIERATYEDVAFRVLSGDQHPDHDSIAEFRRRHLASLAGLFKQVLQLCQKAGLVKLGHVAIDGTKIKANASKHKAMSYDRMSETEKRLNEEVISLLKRAEAADAEEDEKFGKGQRGDDLPGELRHRESRLRKIREAKAALEQEAKERAEREAEEARARIAKREKQAEETGERPKGPSPNVPDAEQAKPEPKAQKNFTDPESRIMKDGATKSFEQAYNAQIAVDGEAQIIVASAVTQQANDKQQLVPMLEQVEQNLSTMPEKVSADAGYFSEANVTDSRLEGVDLHVPPDRQKHGEPVLVEAHEPSEIPSPKDQMRQKLKTDVGHSVYKMRKAIVEPVFGQIKEVRGFRRFSLRGLVKVAAEWDFVCLTHNLLKLFRCKAQLVSG